MRVLDQARRRVAGGEDEGGFALLFVLFVATMVMIGTAAMLTVTVGNIQPAREAQDDYAAVAAAQSGVQDYLAHLNGNCRSASIQACSWLQNNPTLSDTVGVESYRVTALNPSTYLSGNDGTVRLVSTGTAGGSSKTLTADVSGKPSVLRFTYFSNYETLGTGYLNSYYGPRTITLSDPAAAAAAGLPTGSVVHWNGTSSAPANGYTSTVCDALYYDDPSNPAALSGKGRSTVAAGRTGLSPGTDFSEGGYTRTPTQQLLGALSGLTGTQLTSARTLTSRDAPCEVTFSKGMTFTGPVYSRDALLISNGQYGATSGPSFTVPDAEPLWAASTGWSTTAVPAAPASTPYRSDSFVGGTPTTTSTSTTKPLVSPFGQQLSLPSTADPDADCTYTGPTRVLLSGTTATISSPLTPAVSGNPCYTSTGSGSGVVKAVVPITSTTIKVAASSSTTTATPSFPDLTLGAGGDITTYSPTHGDAYVQGSLTSGRLSLVTSDDIVVTGNLTTTTTTGTNSAGERSWASGAAVDLVATGNVRVYHPVACASGSATDGYCPNDISGLYTNAQSGVVVTSSGTLRSTHPSLQYTNVGTVSDRRIDAAVLALTGSLLTDNADRGTALGSLTVNGGVYENHRGATGRLWEVPTKAIAGTRPSSGYLLNIAYLSYANAGLPYVPVLDSSSDGSSSWYVLTVSSGGAR